ncbi:MAG: HD domain-containing protein, partial [Herbinix sp.]|nr:HD domain-containing protein [Herbinix sp.]
MNKKKDYIFVPIKRISFVVMAAIILILICLAFLHNSNRHRGLEDKIILNTFAKQRMYTQMISKDVNRLFALLQADEMGQLGLGEDEINQNISDIRANITSTREKFADNLNAIHSKYITIESSTVYINDIVINQSQYLKKMDTLWIDFDAAIQIIINSKKTDSVLREAVGYINDNNMELLDLSDKLLDQLLENSIRSDKNMEHIAYAMIGLLFIIMLISLIHLQRFIIQPYNQLYKGITEIGLNHYPVNSKVSTRNKVIPLVTEVSDMFLKINYLISLIENINNSNSFMETLIYINKKFSSFIPYNYIGIGLINDDKKILKASYGVSDGTIIGLPDSIVGTTWAVDDTSLDILLNTGEARIINDLEKYCEGKPLKPYNKALLEAGVRASIALPLKVSGEPVGMIFFSSNSKNVYNEGHLNFLSTLANSIAISFNQDIITNEMLYSSILALAKLSEARDEDTGEHMDRMSKYARMIAQLLYDNGSYPEEISIEYIDQIERFSPLHDIGKVGILDGILLKPGKLTQEEFDEMKKHAIFGAKVLKSADKNMQRRGISLFSMGIEIAEGHHEKWDGSGYPYGKCGSEIPLSARIVAIADVFDALTSKRPYKEAFPFDKSVEIIAEGKGSHFDPKIVDVFLENRELIKELYNKFQLQKLGTA